MAVTVTAIAERRRLSPASKNDGLLLITTRVLANASERAAEALGCSLKIGRCTKMGIYHVFQANKGFNPCYLSNSSALVFCRQGKQPPVQHKAWSPV